LYDDETAAFAIVVNPTLRGRGLATKVLSAINTFPELQGVQRFIGSVEPDNNAARRCLAKAGYTIAPIPDEEGMLPIERVRNRN
jgi:RimJ/RimL family protein N-acetyltransferase